MFLFGFYSLWAVFPPFGVPVSQWWGHGCPMLGPLTRSTPAFPFSLNPYAHKTRSAEAPKHFPASAFQSPAKPDCSSGGTRLGSCAFLSLCDSVENLCLVLSDLDLWCGVMHCCILHNKELFSFALYCSTDVYCEIICFSESFYSSSVMVFKRHLPRLPPNTRLGSRLTLLKHNRLYSQATFVLN